MKKKILSFLLVLLLAVCLVACGGKDDASIKVNFETNGGNKIESVEVKADEAGNFKLPENPVKEGYVFKGWFIDAEFKNAFENVDVTKGEFTLYAKWEVAKTPEEMNAEQLEGNWYAAGSNVEFTNDSKVKLNLVLPTGATQLEGSYTVDAAGNVAFKFDGAVIGVPTITAKLDGEKLTFSLLGQSLELKKAPKFEFVAVPTELINFVNNFNGGEITSTGKFEIKTTPVVVPETGDAPATGDAPTNDAPATGDEPATEGSGSTASDVIGDVISGVVKGIFEAIVQLITNADVKLDYVTTVKVNNVKSEKIEDLEAYVNFKGQFELAFAGKKVDDPEFNTYVEMLKDISLYVKDGKAYVTINVPTKVQDETKTEETVYIYSNAKATFSVDLSEIVEFVKGMLEEVPVEEAESEIPAELLELLKNKDANGICEYINNTVNALLTSVYSYGIEPEFVQGVLNVVKGFAPAVTVEGNKTTISYTEAQVDKAFDDLGKFLTDNKQMIKFIAAAAEALQPSDEEETEEPATEEPSFDESFDEALAAIGMAKEALTVKDCYVTKTVENGSVSAVEEKVEFEVNFGSFVLYVNAENKTEVKAYTPFELPEFENVQDVTGDVIEGIMGMLADESESDSGEEVPEVVPSDN